MFQSLQQQIPRFGRYSNSCSPSLATSAGATCVRGAKLAILGPVPPTRKKDTDAAELLATLPAPLRELDAQGVVRH